ncbi:MAG: HEAT repeat domain-containing protein [Nitrospirales bacterium]|nr:HEAT repeat domain-containing protein [Nitrospirales bacterium]
MKRLGIGSLAILLLLIFLVSDGLARRTYFTPEEKARLDNIRVIWVNVLALTERGKVNGENIEKIVQQRMEALGYKVVTSRDEPSDVMLSVKCEERKKWGGTTRAGGDADLVDSPARLWKGPACLFSYFMDGRDMGWYREARTSFEDPAEMAKDEKSGPFAMEKLAERLQEFDFPVMIAAEWGHDSRLLQLLKDSQTTNKRKLKILSMLPEVGSTDAIPYLKEMINDKELAEEAIVALSTSGPEAIPLLIQIFQTNAETSLRAAAAKGLGEIGAHSGDPTVTPPLLDYLKENLKTMKSSADINFPILTEVVWSLGKLRNEQSIPPIRELEKKVWLIYDTSEEMTELRDATNWTVKQIDLDGQIS